MIICICPDAPPVSLQTAAGPNVARRLAPHPHCRGGAHHQHTREGAGLHERKQQRDHLQGLAQARLVEQQAARTPGTPGSSWPATPAARNCTPSRWYGRSFSASAAGTCAVRPSASASSSAAASPSRRRRCVDASAAPWGLLLARSADCSLAAAAAPSSGGTRASPVRDGEVHGSPASPTSTSDTRSTAMCASMASEKAPSEPIENTVCA
jgi:hypothetical protein